MFSELIAFADCQHQEYRGKNSLILLYNPTLRIQQFSEFNSQKLDFLALLFSHVNYPESLVSRTKLKTKKLDDQIRANYK